MKILIENNILLTVEREHLGVVLACLETAIKVERNYVNGDYRLTSEGQRPDIQVKLNDTELPGGTTDETIADLKRQLAAKDKWGWDQYRAKGNLEARIKELEEQLAAPPEPHVGFGKDSLTNKFE